MLAGAMPTMLAPQSSKNHFVAHSIEAFTDGTSSD
jgi:hypothetical protein